MTDQSDMQPGHHTTHLEKPRTRLGGRIRRLFGIRSKPLNEIPEVLGYVTDEDGQNLDVHRGAIRHESLSADQLQRIGRLSEVLHEAYPATLAAWIDGFMRDANPESEIQIIEACAVVYQRLVMQAHLSQDEKRRLYGVLCVISGGDYGPELASYLPTDKGLPQLETIILILQEAMQSRGRP